MQLSRAECLQLAEECRSLAKLAVTIEEKIVFWEREANWTKLASRAELKRATTGIGEH